MVSVCFLAAMLAGLYKGVHPGRYRLKEGMSYGEVITLFKQGHQTPVRVTFNNVRTLPQHLDEVGGCDSFFIARMQKVK